MEAKIIVSESAKSISRELADKIIQILNFTPAKENIYISLSGGSTPKVLFSLLAKEYADKLDWKRIHFYWGDERCVSSSGTDSNYGEAKRLLFDKIDIPAENIHPIYGDNDANDEILRYSNELSQIPSNSKSCPVLDIVILGIGDDGHTASIFPNQMEMLKSKSLVEIAEHPETGQKRISLTGRVLRNAKNIVFLATGETKVPVLKEIINKTALSAKYPAAHIKPVQGNLYYFVDESIAVHL